MRSKKKHKKKALLLTSHNSGDGKMNRGLAGKLRGPPRLIFALGIVMIDNTISIMIS